MQLRDLLLISCFLNSMFFGLIALAESPIEIENRREGSIDWQLTRVRVDGGEFRSPWIEGYCSRQSVKAGETIDVCVSTSPARAVIQVHNQLRHVIPIHGQ